MASAARSLRLVGRSCRTQTLTPKLGAKVLVAWKSVGGAAIKDSKVNIDDRRDKPTPFDHWQEQDDEEERLYKDLGPRAIARMLMRDDAKAEFGGDDSRGLESILDKESWSVTDETLATTQKEIGDSTRPLRTAQPATRKDAFWDDDEADPDLITNDDSDQFEENDMTDIAHAKLEEIREERAQARTIVWEMPLLSKYAVPFEPPTKSQPLRFRFTSYMGEYHPAEKKVVVEFSPKDFGLTWQQQITLKKLAGPRWNPEKKTIKMSCESFEHQAQNKRYLAELVEKLITEAKNSEETFQDIPLDLRYHSFKEKPKFPWEWRISPKRTEQIEAYREETKLLEEAKKEKGTLIDGAAVVKQALEARTRVPVPVTAGKQQQKGKEPITQQLRARF